jgi:hypothetical protein
MINLSRGTFPGVLVLDEVVGDSVVEDVLDGRIGEGVVEVSVVVLLAQDRSNEDGKSAYTLDFPA